MPKASIPDTWEGFAVVDAAAMRALDLAASARHGLPARQLMENAGRAVAAEAATFLRGRGVDPAKASVIVCCGRGANGGDGLVAARALREGGAAVTAFLCPPRGGDGPGACYPELVRDNLELARKAGVALRESGPEAGLDEALARADLVLDALLGTGASGKPAGEIRRMIQEIERSKKPVLALDIPSGLHPDTGHHSGVFVTADLTLTLGLPKRGLLAAHAQKQVGALKVLDIGYPPELLRRKL